MMSRKDTAALILCGVLLSGCASGSAVDYLHTEYGSQKPDGTVDVGTPGNEQIYRVWLHKSKPKINVQTSLGTAAGSGFVKGLTFGGVSGEPVQPVFERAALRYLTETKGPHCRVSNPTKIHDVVWEFDYACDAPRPAPTVRR